MGKMIYPTLISFTDSLPFFPRGMGVCHEQESVDRPKGFHLYQWRQCRKGKGELFIGDRRYVISEGQGFLLFPHYPEADEPHKFRPLGGEWLTDWVVFNGRGVADFFKNTMGLTGSGVFYISSPQRIAAKIEELYYAALSGPSSANRCSLLTFDIMLDIMSLTSKSENASFDDRLRKLEPVISYINANCGKQFTLSELAEIAGVTPQYLSILFKRSTSRTVFEYVNLTRIRLAKELLMSEADMTVRDISEACGFNGESYFCAVFRKYEKTSPLEFRREFGRQ